MMSSMHKDQQGQVGEAREGRTQLEGTGDKTTKQDWIEILDIFELEI